MMYQSSLTQERLFPVDSEAMLPWQFNTELRNALLNMLCQGISRTVMLENLRRDFAIYPWSQTTLQRRLSHFRRYPTPPDVYQSGKPPITVSVIP